MSDLAGPALRAAREHLSPYIAGQWPGLKPAKHLEVVVRELEAVERGEVGRLAIALPPGHAKSTTGSIAFPAWYLGRHPDRYVIAASHTAELATDFGRKVLGLVGSPLHRLIFPECVLSADSASATRFNTTRGGAYFATGVTGALTGRRAHLLVIDDPFRDRAEVASPVLRKAIKEWYSAVAVTRLMPDGAIVLISTRWHQDDLQGWLLREHAAQGWRVLSMPAIAEEDDGFRKQGEALWPEMYPLGLLEAIRLQQGSSLFAADYQQRPVPLEGSIFREGWFRFFSGEPPEFERLVLSLDTAFKTGEENDYSAATVWGETKNAYYVLDLWRDRVEFPELKRVVESLRARWGPSALLIEDKASGQSLIQELQRETKFPVIPIRADRDKRSRANAAAPLVEAGKVFLPDTASWLGDFLDEVLSFPAAKHDDIVDSVTQALNYFNLAESGDGWIQHMRADLEEKDPEGLAALDAELAKGAKDGAR